MGLISRALILLIIIFTCYAFVAHAISGQASFYTPPYVPSSCYGYEGRGTNIVALNGGLFANKGACGKRYRVSCTGGTNAGVPHPCTGNTVDVTVVDLCPRCVGDQIDLSQEAFAVIANPDAGRIKIEFNEI